MERSKERWRRPGIRLAILVLIVVAFYFLAIFVRQSWNLYQLKEEVRVQREKVALLEQENERLRERLADDTSPEGQALLAKDSLLYKEEGERMAVAVAVEEDSTAALEESGEGGPEPEDVTSMPA